MGQPFDNCSQLCMDLASPIPPFTKPCINPTGGLDNIKYEDFMKK